MASSYPGFPGLTGQEGAQLATNRTNSVKGWKRLCTLSGYYCKCAASSNTVTGIGSVLYVCGLMNITIHQANSGTFSINRKWAFLPQIGADILISARCMHSFLSIPTLISALVNVEKPITFLSRLLSSWGCSFCTSPICSAAACRVTGVDPVSISIHRRSSLNVTRRR